MKKSILIISIILTSLILTAFAFIGSKYAEEQINQTPSLAFSYDLGTRFDATITKDKLHNIVSVVDIVPPEADWASFPIHTVHVTALFDDAETSETAESVILNKAQKEMLQTLDYSDNFRIIANCIGKHKNVPDRDVYDLTYFITVIPEKETEYNNGGMDALLEYLKKNSQKVVANARKDKLETGRIYFNINEEGKMTDILLDSSSGYPSIDNKMIQLLSQAPGNWEPARNSKRENVDQELSFTFGRIGC